MNYRIIYIMNHVPAYAEWSNQPRPQWSWDTPDGSWVGMGGSDWADLLGVEVVKMDLGFVFEVWQPDLRADKVYCQTFNGGCKHVLFPVAKATYWYGVKKQIYLTSNNLIQLLENSITPNTILCLPFPNTPLIQSVIRKFKNNKIVCTCLGDLPLPLLSFLKLNKNVLSKFNLLWEHFNIKNLMPYINAFTIINHNHFDAFRKIYSGPFWTIPMGINISKWYKKNKVDCRKLLNLPTDKIILLSSSRLNALKQVDKFIHIMNKLSACHDFLVIITGHGTRQYEEYLIGQAKPLYERKQILFTGYISDEVLLNYYNAADVFIMTSLSEGSPVSVEKAFVCELPVLSTNVGYTAELMLEQGAGIIMPRTNYFKWEENIINILNGNLPKPFNLEVAIKYFSWPNVAQQFINVFKNI